MKNWAILTICVMVGASAAAIAAEPYFPRQAGVFNRVDANKDGKIAPTEFAPIANKQFARMDINGDSQVTADEINKTMMLNLAKRRDRIMKFMDQDANGTITKVELDKLVEAMFNGADIDKDGSLTLTETQGFKRGLLRKAVAGQGGN